jgi:hypothetical protein
VPSIYVLSRRLLGSCHDGIRKDSGRNPQSKSLNPSRFLNLVGKCCYLWGAHVIILIPKRGGADRATSRGKLQSGLIGDVPRGPGRLEPTLIAPSQAPSAIEQSEKGLVLAVLHRSTWRKIVPFRGGSTLWHYERYPDILT